MNPLGIIKSGLAAGLLINLSQYALNTMVLQVPRETLAFWVAYGFGLGFLIAWCYAWLLKHGWESGLKTSVSTAITICFVAGGLNVMVMGYSPIGLYWTLADMIVAGILAGRLYGDPEALASGD